MAASDDPAPVPAWSTLPGGAAGEPMRAGVAVDAHMGVGGGGAGPVRYSAVNHERHGLIREISGQPVAVVLIERPNGQLIRCQLRSALHPGRLQVSPAKHLVIITAITTITARRAAESERAIRRRLISVPAARLDQRQAGDHAAAGAGRPRDGPPGSRSS